MPRAAGVDDDLSLADVTAVVKASAEDFQVVEKLPFVPGELESSGEHLLIRIKKRGFSTVAVQRMLAQFVGCRQHDIGYCGLKDVRAVTEQWFSLPLNSASKKQSKTGGGTGLSDGSCEDWRFACSRHFSQLQQTAPESRVDVSEVCRHNRKLRPGTHSGNHFRIVLREIESNRVGRSADLQRTLEQRLESIRSTGFPNYFGLQRFGRDGSNLLTAVQLIEREVPKSCSGSASRRRLSQPQKLAVSAFRSFLFNLICSARVKNNTWLSASVGEPLLVGSSRSFFIATDVDADIESRLNAGQISTSAALAGSVGDDPAGLACWWSRERNMLDNELSALDPKCRLTSLINFAAYSAKNWGFVTSAERYVCNRRTWIGRGLMRPRWK